MLGALLLVCSPVLHPIAARAGHYVAWYPGLDLVVLAETSRGWRVVRRLGHDNIGALGGHLLDGALTVVYERGAGQVAPPHVPAHRHPAPPHTGLRLHR